MYFQIELETTRRVAIEAASTQEANARVWSTVRELNELRYGETTRGRLLSSTGEVMASWVGGRKEDGTMAKQGPVDLSAMAGRQYEEPEPRPMRVPEPTLVYEARINPACDGMASDVTIGVFLRATEADKAVRGLSSMGTDGTVREMSVYATFEAWLEGDGAEYAGRHPYLSPEDQLRRGALAKLTAEERRVLGLL